MPHAQNLRGTVCSQLLGAHACTTHCDTVSYTVGKGTTSMLKTLKEWAFRTIRRDGGGGCFSGLRGQLKCSSRRCTNNLQASPWFKPSIICILASRCACIILSQPPTDLIIYIHLKRAHFQMLLCKAADQFVYLGVSISLRVWLGYQIWNNLS